MQRREETGFGRPKAADEGAEDPFPYGSGFLSSRYLNPETGKFESNFMIEGDMTRTMAVIEEISEKSK